MKKLIYGAVAALLIGAASCGKSDSASDSAKFFSPEATDSLAISLGELAGYGYGQQVDQMMKVDSTINKEAVMKAFQLVMSMDTTYASLMGASMAIELQQMMYQKYHKLGVDIDRKVMIESLKKMFFADSLDTELAPVLQQNFRNWEDSLRSAYREHKIAELKASDEAITNAEKGHNFITAKAAASDSVKIAPSGLGYKVIKEGEGAKVGENDMVKLSLVGKTAQQRQVENVPGYPVRVSTLGKGVQEGLSKLGKGGKAVLYVPGELAYGVEPTRTGIGLNELIIYEVEVLDINPETAQQPQGGMQPTPEMMRQMQGKPAVRKSGR